MTRPVLLLGSLFLALGAAIFGWKAWGLDMPLLPSQAKNVWRVELEVGVRSPGQRGSVELRLPRSTPEQNVFDEQLNHGGLGFEVRDDHGQRTGVWRGWFEGVRQLTYSFRVQLAQAGAAAEAGAEPEARPEELAAAPGLPVAAPEIEEQLDELLADDDFEPPVLLRRLFAFVADETETVVTGSSDAVLTLLAREGSPAGQARLLATLLRAAGIPARLAAGLQLDAPRAERELVYVEARIDDRWLPLFPSLGVVDRKPNDLVTMQRGGAGFVDFVGLETVDYRYRAVRERLQPEELTALMLPPNELLSAISLYRLPVGTQQTLAVILVLPLAALLVAIFRNLIGIPTFGTFLPILIPLSLRDTPLGIGLAMVAGVLLAGIGARLLLDRFRLLFVPRLCILLCIVVLVLVGLAVGGYAYQSHDVLTGVLLPIVILTMVIERFSITVAEEGGREAAQRMLTTGIVVLAAYPIFQAPAVSQLMFGFPELVLCAMGLLVWIGGYTGYRLTEVLRFRALAMLSRGVAS